MESIKDYASIITLGIGAAIGCIYGEDNRGIMIVLMTMIVMMITIIILLMIIKMITQMMEIMVMIIQIIKMIPKNQNPQ